MPTIDFTTGEVRLRFAAVGPSRAGKSSLLRKLHAMLPPEARGEISMRVAGAEEIVSFDFMPAELIPTGTNHAAATLFSYTGEGADASARARHLSDLDAVLFVTDSRRERLAEHGAALRQFASLRTLREVPIVLLYNKRDLPDAASIEELQAALNPAGATHIAASTFTGEGCNAVLGALVSAAYAANI